MSPETAADTAVLVSAILMLLAIASKLVTANLVTRSKRVYAKLEVARREIASRLKEVQLKRTSAKGTLEFWERRRTETNQRVQDLTRDLENYSEQFEEGGEDEEVVAEVGVDTDSEEFVTPLDPDAGSVLTAELSENGSSENGDSVEMAGTMGEPAGDEVKAPDDSPAARESSPPPR